MFNGKTIEQVFSFKYLGIGITFDSNDLIAQHDLYRIGMKAYFKLMRSINPSPNPCTSLHLFEHLAKPILLYGSEAHVHVWSPIDLNYKGNITNNSNGEGRPIFMNY